LPESRCAGKSCDDREMWRWLLVVCLAGCPEQGSGGGMPPLPDAAGIFESGRACAIGVMPAPGETVVASPALDCPARVCLHVADAAFDHCTAECATPFDCVPGPESQCRGFVCQPVVALGPFACRSFCVCAIIASPPPASCVTGVRPAP